jgi:hypothetical protein
MRRIALVLLLGSLLSLFVASRTEFNQDLLSSIRNTDGRGHQELFDWFSQKGPFQNKVFLQSNDDEMVIPRGLIDDLSQGGYVPISFADDLINRHSDLLRLLPFMSDRDLSQYLDRTPVRETADRIMKILSLPGGAIVFKKMFFA